MEQLLVNDLKGQLDVETGKELEADHHDAAQIKKPATSALFVVMSMKMPTVVLNGTGAGFIRVELCRAK